MWPGGKRGESRKKSDASVWVEFEATREEREDEAREKTAGVTRSRLEVALGVLLPAVGEQGKAREEGRTGRDVELDLQPELTFQLSSSPQEREEVIIVQSPDTMRSSGFKPV